MAFQNCVASSMFPHLYGLDGTTAAFGFSAAAVTYNSLDVYEDWMVAGGKYEITTNPFAKLPDVTLQSCDGIACENEPDITSGRHTDKGIF